MPSRTDIDNTCLVLDPIPLSRYHCMLLFIIGFYHCVYSARDCASSSFSLVELGVGNCVIALVPLPAGPAIAVKVMVDEGHLR